VGKEGSGKRGNGENGRVVTVCAKRGEKGRMGGKKEGQRGRGFTMKGGGDYEGGVRDRGWGVGGGELRRVGGRFGLGRKEGREKGDG